MKGMLLLLLIMISLHIVSNAQYENAPPCSLSNPELIKELRGGVVTGISLWSTASSYGIMATSTLRPTGTNPKDIPVIPANRKLTDEEQQEADIAEIESSNESKDWECQYAAHNLFDGQTTTAWVEGVNGDGIGEAVISGQLDIKKPVKIWSGYGKSEALFKANNRPAKVRIYLLVTNCPNPAQYASNYKSLTVIGIRETILKDVNAYQSLLLPESTKPWQPDPCGFDEESPGIYFVAIEILSVYKGSRYRDTCISEIRN